MLLDHEYVREQLKCRKPIELLVVARPPPATSDAQAYQEGIEKYKVHARALRCAPLGGGRCISVGTRHA